VIREMSLLSAKNLRAYYSLPKGFVRAVDGVSLNVNYGEVLGLAGESGCGKSTFAKTLMMNIRPPLKFLEGRVVIANQDLTNMSRNELRTKVWGLTISLVPQSALNALMPTKRTKDLIREVIKCHRKDLDDDAILQLAENRFRELGLSIEALDMYPHELSGGMRQRVVIAVSTLLNPKLLIADEPTSALDVSTQKQALKMIMDLKRRGIIKSVVFITHDIAILRQIADRIAIMYAGKIVEIGLMNDMLNESLHPYTKGLINAVITPEPEVRKRNLSYISGSPPDLFNPPTGCRFYPRCSSVMDVCKIKEPPLVEVEKGHFVACHLHTLGDRDVKGS